MDRIKSLKKLIRTLAYTLLGVTAILLTLFIIHAVGVSKYNEEWRTITTDSTTTELLVDIHPRGGVTDSWVKNNTGLDMNLNAKIYEMIVTNNARTTVSDWHLRINIRDDCYLNNGWCGKFEVHQFVEGEEKVQLIDLRNYKEEDLTINYHLAAQDLLIPLTSGDYLLYYPDSSNVGNEVPIQGTDEYSGEVVCGVIMYSRSGNVDLSSYELYYRLHKSVWAGAAGRFYITVFTVLILSLIILATIFFVTLRYEERFVVQSRLLEDVLKVCCGLADSRDYYSKEHSRRVAHYSRLIAEKMGMDKSDCDIVYNAALLHNIGNVFISENILRKNGRLTSDEYAEVKQHTTRGAEVLKDINNIPHAAEAAMYHHERYDGQGYPYGKKENEIPLIARIVAVADAYDAMSNDRPYKMKMTNDQIREEFIKNRGTQFDPAIVTAFLDIMGERNL